MNNFTNWGRPLLQHLLNQLDLDGPLSVSLGSLCANPSDPLVICG